jgi:urease accessory protein
VHEKGSKITILSDIELPAATGPQRARGQLVLRSKCRDGRTVIDDLRQSGSLKLLFPRSAQPGLTAVMLNTAGGLTGGDRFDIRVETGPGGTLTLTTQAAERAYRAPPGPSGKVRTHLTVTEGACLHWLPQETLLYDGAAFDRALQIDLADTARLLAVEPVVFGRQAMGERLRDLRWHDRIDLRCNGRLVFADRTRLAGPLAVPLAGSATAAGHGAMASLLYAAPDAADQLDWIRAALPDTAGISQPQPGLIFGRLLATDSFELRRTLVPILERLRGAELPRTWKI